MSVSEGLSFTKLPDTRFWRGRKVLVTGHTGFMGGWLVTWLNRLGARIAGFSLPAPTTPSFYEAVGVRDLLDHEVTADIRDLATMTQSVKAFAPEFVFHLAAQPIVSEARFHPIETFHTNVLGTANLLEAVRASAATRAVLIVTSDKVYENADQPRSFHESDRLGGSEPYGTSKAGAELVANCYRDAYLAERGVSVATLRAGNIIGGGDWGARRLVPDIMRAFSQGSTVAIRHPNAVRPWQHVIEPLRGYLMLAERLSLGTIAVADNSWNFGPQADDHRPVLWIVARCAELWGGGAQWRVEEDDTVPEMTHLALDSEKARKRLGWATAMPLDACLAHTIAWYRAYYDKGDVRSLTLEQIEKLGSVH